MIKNISQKRLFIFNFSLTKILINLCVFFTFIPFFSPFLLDSDLQIIVFLFSSSIFLIDLINLKVTLRKFELYFLFLSIISVFYINIFEKYEYDFAIRFSYALSFTLFYAVTRYYYLITPKIIFFGVMVNFLSAVIHFLYPDLWVATISERLVNTFRGVEQGGGRGVSGLTPEAGFLGAICVYMIIFQFVLFQRKRIGRNNFFFLLFCSLITLFASSSGTGFFMIFVFFSLYFIFFPVKLQVKILVVVLFYFGLVIFWLLFDNLAQYRGLSIIYILVSDPFHIFSDSSILYRLVPVYTGFYSLLDGNLFGMGGGALPDAIVKYSQFYLNEHMQIPKEKLTELGSSAFGHHLTEMGIIFLVFLVLIYCSSKNGELTLPYRFTSFLFILGSFAIVFPPLWVVLAITSSSIRE